MLFGDMRLFGISAHTETIDHIGGLIADFARTNGYNVDDVLPLIEQAAKEKYEDEWYENHS